MLRDEFERDGKKLSYKEIQSEITPTTYALRTYVGEPLGQLKLTSTVRATKITESSTDLSNEIAVQQVPAVDEAGRLAMLHGDVSALDSLLADDVTIFWGDGTGTTRPQRSRCSASAVFDMRSLITRSPKFGYTEKPPL